MKRMQHNIMTCKPNKEPDMAYSINLRHQTIKMASPGRTVIYM